MYCLFMCIYSTASVVRAYSANVVIMVYAILAPRKDCTIILATRVCKPVQLTYISECKDVYQLDTAVLRERTMIFNFPARFSTFPLSGHMTPVGLINANGESRQTCAGSESPRSWRIRPWLLLSLLQSETSCFQQFRLGACLYKPLCLGETRFEVTSILPFGMFVAHARRRSVLEESTLVS